MKIHIDNIRVKHNLRTVDKDNPTYQALVQSIRSTGSVTKITVRKNGGHYEVIDGLHRLSALRDVGYRVIDCHVEDLSDDQLLETQIKPSIHKVETKPVEYAKQLKRLLGRHPEMTLTDLATRLGKSYTWIKVILSLNKIKNTQIKNLIDEGKIVLANAYAIARLPQEEQVAWTNRAVLEDSQHFVSRVNLRVKELRDAARCGVTLPPIENKKEWPIAFGKPIEVDSYELLHGNPPEDAVMRTLESKKKLLTGGDLIEGEPIQRKGWDCVRPTREDKLEYCRGDMLVTETGNCWALYHPKMPRLSNMSFNTAVEAMTFVEEHIK